MITIINFKTYKQGKQVLEFAKKIEKVDKNIIVGLQASDIKDVSSKTKLRVYAQHVDNFQKGRNTGFIIPESVKADGAVGTFLNHSEHRLKLDVIKKTIQRCKKIKLKTAVFASDLGEAQKISSRYLDH
jgi:triosephosphate isomerase